MVASVSALTSSAQAGSYYEADDYYAGDGLSPSAWQGKGAQDLGLSGEINREQFRNLLDGKVAGQQLGTMRHGKIDHRPGWDVTLSAPKSVSIMAEVAGDRRLIVAHGQAVNTALSHIEQYMAATRVREDGAVNRETTDNLVIASFQHFTSRAQDPQLHTHNVILNATKDATGTWRSLEPRAIYQLQKQIGAIYRQELALKVRELGYEIDISKDSLFEIKGISPEVIDSFSTRSAEIETALNTRGKSRDEASAVEKQIAALDTRQAKISVDHTTLISDWRNKASQAGFGPEARLTMVREAESLAMSKNHSASMETQGAIAAHRAVTQAIEKLGERQSVFSAANLHEEAGRIGLGKASYAEIETAIVATEKQGELINHNFIDRRGAEFVGFTTGKNIETETRMLQSEEAGRGIVAPIAPPLDAAKLVASAAAQDEREGKSWNGDQRLAAAQLLSSRNRITALQGYAGTAKTTTVLSTFAREAEARGVSIVGLAPTASAAMVLGEALGARSDTVARHLLSPELSHQNKSVAWIVDEASLLSARDTAKLFDLAEKHNARVILVGDVKQLGSVEAGAAFAQLQSAGMETAKLSEIVRQKNAASKDAVIASIEGDAKKVLAALDRGGGEIVECDNRAERFAIIAEKYAKLDKASRARTIVIEPSREGRDTLTEDIRVALTKSGALTGPGVMTESLSNKGLTRAETRDPLSYATGDIVRFTQDYIDKGVMRGAAYNVVRIDHAKSAIILKSEDNKIIDWRLRQWGAGKVQVFTPQPLELKTGDNIRFIHNDREAGRINGVRGEVIAVNEQTRKATIQTQNGKTETLNLNSARDRHIAHAYVDTAFAAQGRTADHVMIHADSQATNLVDQKSFYVGVSRAKESATIFTNDRGKLISAINERAGLVQSAIAHGVKPAHAAGKVAGVGMG